MGRMLIYSGNVDACVPYWGSEEWTRQLGFPVREAWRPWTSGSRDEPNAGNVLAGYVTVYDSNSTDFTFLTVAGAGHLVPQHKPVQALHMLQLPPQQVLLSNVLLCLQPCSSGFSDCWFLMAFFFLLASKLLFLTRRCEGGQAERRLG